MREMKDSGVEWIGEIPKDWKLLRNKRVMRKEKEIHPVYLGEDVLSLTMNGVIIRDLDNPYGKMPTTFDGYQYIRKGNLLMCLFDIDVTPRCIGIIRDNGVTSPAYSQFSVTKENYAPYYYYYYLYLDHKKELLHLAKNLRHSFTEDQLGELFVPVPSLEEQKIITAYLDSKCSQIDTIISKQEQIIEKLKEYKLSVITETVTKGLDSNVEMKDSGIEWLGRIPAHWNTIKVKHLGTYRNGLTYSPDDIVDEDKGTIVLRSSNIQEGKLVFDDNVYVDTNAEASLVKKGDILICSRNGSKALIGKNALIDMEIRAYFGAFMMIFRCDSPEYIRYILNSSIFSYYLGSFFTSTINQLTGGNFGNMIIPYCPEEKEQKSIVGYLDKKLYSINQSISKKIEIIENLKNYKKSLIYEVVTGKKEV